MIVVFTHTQEEYDQARKILEELGIQHVSRKSPNLKLQCIRIDKYAYELLWMRSIDLRYPVHTIVSIHELKPYLQLCLL